MKMEKLSLGNLVNHWLLNTAIDFPRPLLHILPKVRDMTLNAKRVPGCLPDDYVKGLGDLYLSGHILFSSEDPRDDVKSASGVAPILTRFRDYSIEPPEERYARGERKVDPRDPKIPRVELALTESGGALWEGVAKPAWDRFYDELSDYETGEMVSPDLTLLMARMGWFSELLNDTTIDIQSIKLEERSDYPVLYWKRLPHVYRATFKCQRAEARWKKFENSDCPIEPDWFRKWWPTTVTFYTNPWELPDWPRSS
jgi:hypothetical protein